MTDSFPASRASSCRRGARYWAVGATIVSLAIVANTWPVRAQGDVDPKMISLGMSVWKEKIGCNQCHGWSGNGVPDDSRMPVGANLRQTQLTHDELIEVVKCGRPGTGMPHFDARAYTDNRCYGVTADQLGDKVPPSLGTSLIPRETEAVVDYIEAKVKDRGPFTRQDCEDYFGKGASVCGTFTYPAGGNP